MKNSKKRLKPIWQIESYYAAELENLSYQTIKLLNQLLHKQKVYYMHEARLWVSLFDVANLKESGNFIFIQDQLFNIICIPGTAGR